MEPTPLNAFHYGLNPIVPFDQKRLAPAVCSDHAEIAFLIFERQVVNVWNISNPAHHHYFKSTPTFPTAPFHNTHLYVEKPYVDGKLDIILQEKVNNQSAWIAQRFKQKQVSVQVIVEGYEGFYKEIAEKIKKFGHEQFEIYSVLNSNPGNISPTKNVTAIIVDTSRLAIEDRGIVSDKYKEDANGRDCDFVMPYVRIRDLQSKQSMVIAGVHVPGADNCHPISGLGVLNKHIHALHAKYEGKCDIVATGDFNTPPLFSKVALVGMEFLLATYGTHVNPRSEAAIYDQTVILKGSSPLIYNEIDYHHQLLPASEALIEAIYWAWLDKGREKKPN